MASRENPLNRRARLLEQEWERRANAIERQLFEPEPPFRVKMSEEDAFRKYMDDEENGFFQHARESQGGWMRDADVDAYAAWGQRMKAKFAPHLFLRDATNGQPEYGSLVEQVRRAHDRFNDPNDTPEEHDAIGNDADDGF